MARLEKPRETPRETATIALGLLAFCTGVIVLLLAFVLGFSFEASPSDMADSTKSQQMAIPAVIAVLVGTVACAGRRRGWALTVGWVGTAAAVVAVLLTVLLPGGDQLVQS